MAMKHRVTPAFASILVSLGLGAAVLMFLLNHPAPTTEPRTVKPPVAAAKAPAPVKPKRLAPAVAALWLPPPPMPVKARKPAKVKASKAKKLTRRAPAKPLAAKPPAARRARLKAPPMVARAVKPPASPPPKTRARPLPAKKQKATPKPKRRDQGQAGTIITTRATRREGRTLLRLLEYGKGPTIEIAWPDSESHRDRLYREFRECFGMRNAVMTADGQLFGETGPSGAPWAINLDRFSGFLRHPAGRKITAEHARGRGISARHGIHGRLVRIFPRNVDANILGGLSQVIGSAYKHAKTITASYTKRRGRLVLDTIRVNGRLRQGAVDIGSLKRRGCLI